ncbi:cytochrome c maturation protein CcmE [Neoehrlichia mikurensis]|uniref:Cytochrome c-type biogenesis protein CcmE n=1 Tax=Neoehrlichia mikurensis TaxID=89586 RepID=A0A9Q9BXJ4_9RICK|nr:cytochrome c maturation protein CcmE [Neoehrlichia mikurensis]QXK92073.1 cytochrome c maturation protein CcmE [Neoehrlichia mikurensis]QXK92530.1 cytochrome c maturation protein CcmE [Neoehrlichia mikurensis]QXK93766.1 cytochrome c maturation protein CcmE [Neoehrlichia mikurensis]UTO55258.1 cytochrome c maturation protein CcmE [Neoehrlichia mikurensis]UTO56179.1 cytochrome c maturation protein CcmE [Neoehrlichia mikurensis]
MKQIHKRLLFIIISFTLFGIVILIVLTQLKSSISFFYTINEVLSEKMVNNKGTFRIGGIVVKGSIKKNNNTITFNITDLTQELTVIYQGILPPLFLEGSNIVAKGHMSNGVFIAQEILAKHDENYMPKKYNLSTNNKNN